MLTLQFCLGHQLHRTLSKFDYVQHSVTFKVRRRVTANQLNTLGVEVHIFISGNDLLVIPGDLTRQGATFDSKMSHRTSFVKYISVCTVDERITFPIGK